MHTAGSAKQGDINRYNKKKKTTGLAILVFWEDQSLELEPDLFRNVYIKYLLRDKKDKTVI